MNRILFGTLTLLILALFLLANCSAQNAPKFEVGNTFTYVQENNTAITSVWTVEEEDKQNNGVIISIVFSGDSCTRFRYVKTVDNDTLIVYRERAEGSAEACNFDYTYDPGYIFFTSGANFTSISKRVNQTNGNETVTIVSEGQVSLDEPIETPSGNYSSISRIDLLQENTSDNSTVEYIVWVDSVEGLLVRFSFNPNQTFELESISFTVPANSSTQNVDNSTSPQHTSNSSTTGSLHQLGSLCILVLLGAFLLL